MTNKQLYKRLTFIQNKFIDSKTDYNVVLSYHASINSYFSVYIYNVMDNTTMYRGIFISEDFKLNENLKQLKEVTDELLNKE